MDMDMEAAPLNHTYDEMSAAGILTEISCLEAQAVAPDAGSLTEPPAVDPDSHLPKSSSSAMPDLSASSVPRLKARVHERLNVERCAQLRLKDLEYRALRPEDYEETVALHTEWFPVSYDEAFYLKSVRGEIFTLAAVHNSPPQPTRDGSGVGGLGNGFFASPGAASSSSPSSVPSTTEADLLGIVTMSINCEHHADDIMHVLGADCATLCRKRGSGKESLMSNDVNASSNTGCLAYILTLGISEGFRRRGLARELLQRSIDYVDRNMHEVQAIYLHVVTYNEAAIQLYESMRFQRLARFTSFYQLHGHPYDSFLYARYLHHGRPPWKWRLRKWFGLDSASAWTDWLSSIWRSSIWRNDGTLESKPSDGEDTMLTP